MNGIGYLQIRRQEDTLSDYFQLKSLYYINTGEDKMNSMEFILSSPVAKVNITAIICVPKIIEESTNFDFNDLLENIKLLLNYIIKNRRKMRRAWLKTLNPFPISINDPCMDISRELAITILKYLDQHQDFYFPFLVVNREYTPEDDDFVEIEPNEWEVIESDENYRTFQLWENLQDLRTDTLELMAKGFIEKIVGEASR